MQDTDFPRLLMLCNLLQVLFTALAEVTDDAG